MRGGMMVAFATIAALGGCGAPDATPGNLTLENVTVAEVANGMAEARIGSDVQGGEWETRFEVKSVDLKGMADGPQRDMMMAQMVPPPTERRACLTKEQAGKVDPSQLAKVAKDCRFERYAVVGGNLDGKLRCTGPNGPIEIVMKGTRGATSSDIAMTQTIALPDGMTAVMDIRIASRRIGDCPK